MTIGVTGAAGLLGANLVRALLARGEAVRALVFEDSRGVDGLAVERVAVDVRDLHAVTRALAGLDVVYHLAARISIQARPDPALTVANVEGTRNVLTACRANGVRRLVHFSSIHALSPHPGSAIVDESRGLNDGPDAGPYDRSKAQAEALVYAAVAAGLDAVVVNPSGVVGPYDFKPSAFGGVLRDLQRRRFPALVDGGFNWVDARDVAAGAIAAAARGRTGERYLLAGHHHSITHVAALVEEITGTPPPRVVAPMWLARAGVPVVAALAALTGDAPRVTTPSLRALREHQAISVSKAARELGYQPRSLRETLADTFAWFRAQGLLG